MANNWRDLILNAEDSADLLLGRIHRLRYEGSRLRSKVKTLAERVSDKLEARDHSYLGLPTFSSSASVEDLAKTLSIDAQTLADTEALLVEYEADWKELTGQAHIY